MKIKKSVGHLYILINLLIRTSFRPDQFKRCLDSVRRQTYPEIRIIVGYDLPQALNYIPINIESVEMKPETGKFFYNRYINQLKELVTGGCFFCLDDDDFLMNPKVIARIAPQLIEGANIVQFVRNNARPKPKDDLMDNRKIVCGHIGFPCLILHHSFKNVADLDGEDEFGDYTWIKRVAEQVPTKFIKEPLVVAERRSFGRVYLNQKVSYE